MTAGSLAEAPRRLFATRQKVYARDVSGLFRRIKWAALLLVLAVYYGTPWIRFDRGEGVADQAVLIDMAGPRAYFFFIEIWPQDIYLLTLLLILAALFLFFATSLVGRVWCSYACPQTVWTDLFMWVERKVEGDGPRRRKQDQGSKSIGLMARKSLKHMVWLGIALATGGAWIFYFQDAPTAAVMIFTGQASMTVYFFIGLFTATTYLLGGWAREQVCTYMCPWPRFQAAMFDEDTMIVSYQPMRGEPRSRHVKRNLATDAAVGDCVDCGLCLDVCPTGVDIRDGNQLECIGCGLCVDACNNVMSRLGREPYLIRHDTERNLDRLRQGLPRLYKLMRFRTAVYLVLIIGLGTLTGAALVARPLLELDVIADRAPLFVTLSDGSVRNGYALKVINKTHDSRTFTVETEGLDGAQIRLLSDPVASPDGVTTARLFVTASPDGPAVQPYKIKVIDQVTGEQASEAANFRRSGRVK